MRLAVRVVRHFICTSAGFVHGRDRQAAKVSRLPSYNGGGSGYRNLQIVRS